MFKVANAIGLAIITASCSTGYGTGSPTDAGAATALPDEEVISFRQGPCYGTCPIFQFNVASNGEGNFIGANFVAQQGVHHFNASPEQIERFRARIERFRPEASVAINHENCEVPVRTDHSTLSVTWSSPDREDVTLDWYLGCLQPGYSEGGDDLIEAWQELPVAQLVGSENERQDSRDK